MLAVDFELDRGAYRIAKIYESAATDLFGRNPLTSSGVNVHEGDFLLAVNGVPIDVSKDHAGHRNSEMGTEPLSGFPDSFGRTVANVFVNGDVGTWI